MTAPQANNQGINEQTLQRAAPGHTKVPFRPSPLQSKILGFIALVVCAFLLGRSWLKPEVPEELQNYGNPSPTAPIGSTTKVQDIPAPDKQPIALESLTDMESDKGAPPPALTNQLGKQNQESSSGGVIAPNLKNAPVQTSMIEDNPQTAEQNAADIASSNTAEQERERAEQIAKQEQAKRDKQAKIEKEKKEKERKAKLEREKKEKERKAKLEREKKEKERKEKERKEKDRKEKSRKAEQSKAKQKLPPPPKLELTSSGSKGAASNSKTAEKADKWLQVGVYAKKDNADKVVSRLRRNGFSVKTGPIQGGKTRVSVGPYRQSEVAAARRKLNSLGGL